MMGLEARLRRIEQMRGNSPRKIYIFSVGNHPDCNFESEKEMNKELEKPKYKNAIIIRDLDRWIDEVDE